MKFINAYQEIHILAAEIENFKQSGELEATDFNIVCLESHRSQVERLTAIPIETINESDIEDGNFLKQFGLEEGSLSLYNDLIAKGGYVLLARDEIADSDVVRKVINTDDENEMHPPGFGVDNKPPQTSEHTKEDNVDPNNPTPPRR